MAGTVKGHGGAPAEEPATQDRADTVEGVHPDLQKQLDKELASPAATVKARPGAQARQDGGAPVSRQDGAGAAVSRQDGAGAAVSRQDGAAVTAENAWKVSERPAPDSSAVSQTSLDAAGVGSGSGAAVRVVGIAALLLLLVGGAVWLLSGDDAQPGGPEATVTDDGAGPGADAPPPLPPPSETPPPSEQAAADPAAPQAADKAPSRPRAPRRSREAAPARSGSRQPGSDARPRPEPRASGPSTRPANGKGGSADEGSTDTPGKPAGADNPAPSKPAGGKATGSKPASAEDLERFADDGQERDIVSEMYGNQVRRVVREFYAPRARACFDGRTRNNPDLRGRVVIDLTIGADGHVLNTAVASNNTGDEPLGRCLAARIKTWRLPAPPRAPTHVKLPFSR